MSADGWSNASALKGLIIFFLFLLLFFFFLFFFFFFFSFFLLLFFLIHSFLFILFFLFFLFQVNALILTTVYKPPSGIATSERLTFASAASLSTPLESTRARTSFAEESQLLQCFARATQTTS